MIRALDRNARTGLLAFLLVAAMVGVAYASVPLYRMFCQVTGYGGTTQVATAAEAADAAARSAGAPMISIRFDANTASDMPWMFRSPAVPR